MQSVVAAITIRRVDAHALASPDPLRNAALARFSATPIRLPPLRRRGTVPDDPILAASLAAKRVRMGGFVVRIAPGGGPVLCARR
jgi:transcriptional regulator with GAF, ATPase, and Fis domain